MKRLDEISPPLNASQTPQEPAKLSEPLINELWRRMAEIYGHKWVSSFGETDMDDTWARGLNDLSPQDLSNGLAACLAREDSWPPTLPEFIKLCKPKDEKPAYHEIYLGLPAPQISKEDALKHLEEIREKLKQSSYSS